MQELRDKMTTLEARMGVLEGGMSEVNASVASIQTSVGLVIDILNTIKGGVRFFFVLGVIAKWCTTVMLGVAAIFALITWIKTGSLPKID